MKKIILTLASIALITSCSKKEKQSDIVLFNEINMDSKAINTEKTAREGNAHSGKFYASVDSISVYNAGYVFIIPDSLKNKNMTVYVSGWVREAQAPLNGEIILSLSTSKGNVSWNSINKQTQPYNGGEWVQFSDSISYPSQKLQDAYTEIGVFGMKTKGSDAFDMDDLQIKYKFSN